MISLYCCSPLGSSPDFYISLSAAGKQADKMHHVPVHWCEEAVWLILPHYPTLLQLASRAVPVLHWKGEATRVSWCFHLLQPCFQLKGQNDIIMLVSERNCSETVQQHEAMRRHGLSVLLPPHNGLAMFFVLMRQPTKSTQTSVSEDLSHQVTTH